MTAYNITNTWMWVGFAAFIVFALMLDTIVLDKKMHPEQSLRVAFSWSLLWISSALVFNLLLWFYLSQTTTPTIAYNKSLDFFTGYLIEKSLSVDNLFAFYMIFTQFHIPPKYQHRVFSYGIWSAIVFRLILILIGSWLVKEFHWFIYVMGAFLLLTGIKMFFAHEKKKDLSDTLTLKLVKMIMRVTHEIKSNHFFVKKNHLWYATPLFVALIFIEISDLVFAFDSIPAIFAITTDPFIVWTSNIFAILGLRALYFVLAGMVSRFHLLKFGIALILIFVGVKMIVEPWMDIPVQMSLGVIAAILIVFSLLSIFSSSPKRKA